MPIMMLASDLRFGSVWLNLVKNIGNLKMSSDREMNLAEPNQISKQKQGLSYFFIPNSS